MTLIPEYIMHIARECWATLPKDGRGIDHIARAILASIRTEGRTWAPSAKDALHAIANLTTPMSLEQMSGHEDAYRAVERLFAAPPEIEANPAPSSHVSGAETAMDAYMRLITLFDQDATAASFLSEDGEGGFVGGVYRMAREIDRLRALSTEGKP